MVYFEIPEDIIYPWLIEEEANSTVIEVEEKPVEFVFVVSDLKAEIID